MKKLKKIALLLVGVLMVGMLAGCGQKFDAQAYVKALLDASYKNDSAAFVRTRLVPQKKLPHYMRKVLILS